MLRSESGNRDACVIDCEGIARFAVFFAFDTAVVESVTIRNGDAAGNGGALLMLTGSNPTIIDCVFEACSASNGGAIAVVEGGDATIDGCVFSGGEAGQGGGVFARAGNIVRCTFIDNVAGAAGGGAHLGAAFEEISDSLFVGNANPGLGGGGGIALGSGDVVVRNVVLRENTANFGAGAVSVADTGTFVNCLFDCNEAVTPPGGDAASGGAVDNGVGTTSFINCTFVGNTCDAFGGALSVNLDGESTVVGSIFWANEAPNGAQIRVSYPGFFEGGTVIASHSNVAGGEGEISVGTGGSLMWMDGNIDADPLFDAHHCPTVGSPVIDAGDDAAVPGDVADDIYGRPRFIDGGDDGAATVDMGACEFQTCPTDIDRDGEVGFGDLLPVLAAWGPCGTCPLGRPEDLDLDGEVAFGDLLIVLAAWGPCP